MTIKQQFNTRTRINCAMTLYAHTQVYHIQTHTRMCVSTHTHTCTHTHTHTHTRYKLELCLILTCLGVLGTLNDGGHLLIEGRNLILQQAVLQLQGRHSCVPAILRVCLWSTVIAGSGALLHGIGQCFNVSRFVGTGGAVTMTVSLGLSVCG